MKNIVFAFGLLLVSGLVGAQKIVNDPNAEIRTVASFHAIHVSSAFDVILTQSAEEGLAVSADHKEDIPYITTSVENGVLRIGFEQKNKWWPKNHKLKAYIAVKNLDELKASGASDVKVDGSLAASNLKIDFSGASDLKGKLVINGKLDVELSGASDMNINGSANEVAINASGASDVKAYDFTAATCSVEASGASNVHITVDKELSARLSGASNVSYKGAALIRDIKTSGASSISRKS